jgi:hypothetical protein
MSLPIKALLLFLSPFFICLQTLAQGKASVKGTIKNKHGGILPVAWNSKGKKRRKQMMKEAA